MTCILIGCIQIIPIHLIGFERNGVSLKIENFFHKTENSYQNDVDIKSCYLDNVFYQNCNDTQDKLVLYYHNLLKTKNKP